MNVEFVENIYPKITSDCVGEKIWGRYRMSFFHRRILLFTFFMIAFVSFFLIWLVSPLNHHTATEKIDGTFIDRKLSARDRVRSEDNEGVGIGKDDNSGGTLVEGYKGRNSDEKLRASITLIHEQELFDEDDGSGGYHGDIGKDKRRRNLRKEKGGKRQNRDRSAYNQNLERQQLSFIETSNLNELQLLKTFIDWQVQNKNKLKRSRRERIRRQPDGGYTRAQLLEHKLEYDKNNKEVTARRDEVRKKLKALRQIRDGDMVIVPNLSHFSADVSRRVIACLQELNQQKVKQKQVEVKEGPLNKFSDDNSDGRIIEKRNQEQLRNKNGKILLERDYSAYNDKLEQRQLELIDTSNLNELQLLKEFVDYQKEHRQQLKKGYFQQFNEMPRNTQTQLQQNTQDYKMKELRDRRAELYRKLANLRRIRQAPDMIIPKLSYLRPRVSMRMNKRLLYLLQQQQHLQKERPQMSDNNDEGRRYSKNICQGQLWDKHYGKIEEWDSCAYRNKVERQQLELMETSNLQELQLLQQFIDLQTQNTIRLRNIRLERLRRRPFGGYTPTQLLKHKLEDYRENSEVSIRRNQLYQKLKALRRSREAPTLIVPKLSLLRPHIISRMNARIQELKHQSAEQQLLQEQQELIQEQKLQKKRLQKHRGEDSGGGRIANQVQIENQNIERIREDDPSKYNNKYEREQLELIENSNLNELCLLKDFIDFQTKHRNRLKQIRLQRNKQLPSGGYTKTQLYQYKLEDDTTNPLLKTRRDKVVKELKDLRQMRNANMKIPRLSRISSNVRSRMNSRLLYLLQQSQVQQERKRNRKQVQETRVKTMQVQTNGMRKKEEPEEMDFSNVWPTRITCILEPYFLQGLSQQRQQQRQGQKQQQQWEQLLSCGKQQQEHQQQEHQQQEHQQQEHQKQEHQQQQQEKKQQHDSTPHEQMHHEQRQHEIHYEKQHHKRQQYEQQEHEHQQNEQQHQHEKQQHAKQHQHEKQHNEQQQQYAKKNHEQTQHEQQQQYKKQQEHKQGQKLQEEQALSPLFDEEYMDIDWYMLDKIMPILQHHQDNPQISSQLFPISPQQQQKEPPQREQLLQLPRYQQQEQLEVNEKERGTVTDDHGNLSPDSVIITPMQPYVEQTQHEQQHQYKKQQEHKQGQKLQGEQPLSPLFDEEDIDIDWYMLDEIMPILQHHQDNPQIRSQLFPISPQQQQKGPPQREQLLQLPRYQQQEQLEANEKERGTVTDDHGNLSPDSLITRMKPYVFQPEQPKVWLQHQQDHQQHQLQHRQKQLQHQQQQLQHQQRQLEPETTPITPPTPARTTANESAFIAREATTASYTAEEPVSGHYNNLRSVRIRRW